MNIRGAVMTSTLAALVLGAAVAGARTTVAAPSPVTLTVAVASDLKFAFPELVGAFNRGRPEVTIKPVFGSSGQFAQQIANRAPFDAFLSADVDYPLRLVDEGHAIKESLMRYAVGRIVLWVPPGSRLDVKARGLQALKDPGVIKVAIANPRHAPYGRAAEAALRHAGVFESVEKKLVLGENIAQAAQFAETGAADAGIIALSVALAPGMRAGSFVEIPADAHPAMVQGAAIMTASPHRVAASGFLAFLQTDAAREIFRRHGFGDPPSAAGP